MWEWFDHTADLGLRVRAPRLAELFEDAARGLIATIVAGQGGGPTVASEIRIAGTRYDWLLFDWLNELLYRFDRNGEIPAALRVEVDPQGLVAEVSLERLDLSRHRALREVKAITYHGLRVEQEAEGWVAEVVLDI